MDLQNVQIGLDNRRKMCYYYSKKKSSDVEEWMEKSGNPLCHAGFRGVKVQAGKDFLRGIGGDAVSFQLYTPHDSSCCTLPIRDENDWIGSRIYYTKAHYGLYLTYKG